MKILKDIRESVGLSQKKLSELSGVHRKTLYEMETNDRGCSEETLNKLSKTLAQFTDLAYVAGLFDRNSVITITKNKIGTTNTQQRPHYIAKVTLSSKHKILCELVKQVLECGLVTTLSPNKHRKEPRYEFYAFSKQAELAAERLLPYLKIKREKAKVLLAFREELMSNKVTRGPSIMSGLGDLDWDSIGETYEAFYKRIREV